MAQTTLAKKLDLDTHAAATTAVHGITDTSKLMVMDVAQTRTKTLTINDGATPNAAWLGIGVAPLYPLHVKRADGGDAINVTAFSKAISASQDHDWAGQAADLVNLDFFSTGDGIFIRHAGGIPPGYAGPQPGGNGGLNVLVPFYLGSRSTGRDPAEAAAPFGAGVVNDRTGMVGLFIQTQAPNANVYGISLKHHGNGQALYINNQPAGVPQGTGGPLQIDDASAATSIAVSKTTALADNGKATLLLGTTVASALDMLRVNDSGGFGRVLHRADGQTVLGLNYPTASPYAAKLQVEFKAAGIQRNLALTNQNGADSDGMQLEFVNDVSQQALVQGFVESRASSHGSLRLHARNAGTMREYLRVDGANDRVTIFRTLLMNDGFNVQLGTTTGTKIGTATTQKLAFYNATPIAQQARPVTLADVIAAGTALGIWA